ncbi:MAG: ABC transporter permease [Bacteroidota bacterium]
MIWTIAKKELLEDFYSFKFRIVAIVCVLIVFVSNVTLLEDYKRRLEDYSLNLPKSGEARAIIKPSVLSLYASGLRRNMERGYDIRPGTLIAFPGATILNLDFFSSRFHVPDVTYLVKVVLSLLAMLTVFDTFCGEKVRGTLRLVLSNGLPRTHVVLGKILGNLIALVIPFTFSLLLGLLLIIFLGKVTITAEELSRICAVSVGSVLYLSIFVFLAITVSARTRLPSTSLVICLFLWTILVFGIPNVSGTIARAMSAIPSSQTLEEEKMLTYVMEGGFLLARGETDMNKVHERVRQMENEYRNLLNRYVETTKKVSRLSPASSYVYFTSSICQSGFEDERHLKQLVLRYRDALLQNPEKGPEIRFTYNPLTLSESFQNVTVEVLTLLFFAAIFFATCYTSFLRYDVR